MLDVQDTGLLHEPKATFLQLVDQEPNRETQTGMYSRHDINGSVAWMGTCTYSVARQLDTFSCRTTAGLPGMTSRTRYES